MRDKKLAFEGLYDALLDPVRSLPASHMALADAAWAAGDSERALSETQTVIRTEPDSEPAAQRVLEYGMKVAPAQAIAATRAFIPKHPDSRKLQLMLVGHLLAKNDVGQENGIGSRRERVLQYV